MMPRALHPGAWWLWALALAVIAARTTNPLLLGLVIAVAALVVAARREDAPWGRAFGLYVRVGVLIVVIRVGMRVILGGDTGGHVLVSLPELPLPDWMAGVRIGGDVSAEALIAASVDGLRLAAIVICFGAANSLANPRRVLRLLPNALYEVGASITVALSLAPQLAISVARVRRAQRLRGGANGRRGVGHLIMPVLEDALDRSIALAAAMDARGYGRRASETVTRRRITTALLIGGLLGTCVGMYGLLDATSTLTIGVPALVAGIGLMATGFVLAGRRVRHSRYRPDRWLAAEWAVAAAAFVALGLVLLGGMLDPASLHISVAPISWPQLAWLPSLGVLAAALPAVVAPMPPLRFAAEQQPSARVAPSVVARP